MSIQVDELLEETRGLLVAELGWRCSLFVWVPSVGGSESTDAIF